MKVTKYLGLAIFLAYLFSICLLFIVDGSLIYDIINLGLTGLNLEGSSTQVMVGIINYFILGILISTFGFTLSKQHKSETPGKIGSYFFIVSGLGWMSFSFTPFLTEGTTTSMLYLHYLKIFFSWGAGVIALVLICMELKDKLLRTKTVLIVIFMILEMFYYWFIEYSGIISILSWTFYFSWFALFSLNQVSGSNIVSQSEGALYNRN